MSASAAIVGLRPLRIRVASSRACAASASASAPAFGLGGEPKVLAVSGVADGAGMTPRSGGMMRGGDFVVDAPHPMTHFTIVLAARAGGDAVLMQYGTTATPNAVCEDCRPAHRFAL